MEVVLSSDECVNVSMNEAPDHALQFANSFPAEKMYIVHAGE